jgi:hypothetical protein
LSAIAGRPILPRRVARPGLVVARLSRSGARSGSVAPGKGEKLGFSLDRGRWPINARIACKRAVQHGRSLPSAGPYCRQPPRLGSFPSECEDSSKRPRDRAMRPPVADVKSAITWARRCIWSVGGHASHHVPGAFSVVYLGLHRASGSSFILRVLVHPARSGRQDAQSPVVAHRTEPPHIAERISGSALAVARGER